MNKEVKTETKKTNKTLVNLLAGIVVAVIATASSYNYWHDTNIRVTFHADSDRSIQYQVFYSTKDNGFHEDRSVRQDVKAGRKDVKIVLPADNVKQIRLDFGYKPGEVIISELKIEGNESVKFADFDSYKYLNIKDHTINEDGSLTIVSDDADPYIITIEELEVYPGDDYDWLRMGLIAGGSFIVAFLLAMLINRKKK